MKVLTAFLDRRREQRTQRLYDEGRELVDSYAYEEALKVGRKLRKLRYSGAFEIEALAYSGLEQHEDAVRVLREGLALAPAAWPNWMLLGSCLSDLKRYSEASLAYDRAAACEGSDRTVLDFNRAIVAWRQKHYPEALRLLDNVLSYESEEFRLRVVSLRVQLFHDLGRNAEAEDLASRTLHAWRDAESEEGTRDIGEIAAVRTKIRRERGDDRERLRGEAIEWWRHSREDQLLWEIRELQSQYSPQAQYFRLMIEARLSPDSEMGEHAEGFHIKVDAVADTPEEALAYYGELEFLQAEFRITGTEVMHPAGDSPKGVYWLSGRVFYKEEPSPPASRAR